MKKRAVTYSFSLSLRSTWFFASGLLASLVSEGLEIKAFGRRKLRPSFYLCTQLCKALFVTWCSYDQILGLPVRVPRHGWSRLVGLVSKYVDGFLLKCSLLF